MEVASTSSVEIIQPSTSSSLATRLGHCEVCMIEDAKYTCPKCEVKYCCLKCSGIHKRELECSGIRDRTKFIPLNKFTNLDLSSDYRLLEEIGRRVETYKKEYKKKCYGMSRHEVLPYHLRKLKDSVTSKKTTLKFLPCSFVRHKENTTRVNFHKDVVYWRIDWIFVGTENVKLIDHKVRETEKIGSILQKYFVKQDNAIVQEKLQYFQSLGLTGIKVFLQAEEKAGYKYYDLEIDESLTDNLKNKVIIEYPTIYVVNKDHCGSFDVIDSDEDDVMIVDSRKSGDRVINRIIRKAESDDSIYNSLRNLLFVSDSEDEQT